MRLRENQYVSVRGGLAARTRFFLILLPIAKAVEVEIVRRMCILEISGLDLFGDEFIHHLHRLCLHHQEEIDVAQYM